VATTSEATYCAGLC